MDFKDKVVIVTGASSGIGAATAQYFATFSAKLVLVGRNEDNLKNVAKRCKEAKGIQPLVVKADVTIDSDVERIIKDTIKTFRKIDVLVNNAGVGAVAGIRDGIHHLDKALSTNLRSVYLLTSLAVPYLTETKGNIVNVSSICSEKVVPNYLPYCVSKAGLDMFIKCVAKELAPGGIRVNSVNPGPVTTNFHRSAGFKPEQLDAVMNERLKNSPLGKIGTSDEVANLIIYLASNRAGSITGSIYNIDNGFLLT